MDDDVLTTLLAAVAARRLVVFTGAGLSMPAPSSLPSAKRLALECAARHEANTGEEFSAADREDIEAQARRFLSRGTLQSYFLGALVDWRRFAGDPNAGHFAVADFLLSGAVDLSITTNVDVLVERAAEGLGEPMLVGAIDGTEAATPRAHQPLMKLHGCIRHGVEHTLWCREQLDDTAWQERIENSAQWLTGRLVQRDIVFVGYWTDWPYLNEVLVRVLRHQVPRSVTLVDPSSPEDLAQKAPGLWSWAHGEGVVFRHVQASGSEFLDTLRRRFSHLLLKRMASVGRDAYVLASGATCPSFPSIDACSTDDLYDLRRDWSGVPRNAVTRRRIEEPVDELLGKVFFDLVAAGGVLEGSNLLVGGRRVRLVQGAGRMLYAVKSALAGDVPPIDPPEVTVCVGADDDGGVPPDILRPERRPSVIRPGTSGEWCTHTSAPHLLGIT